MTEFNLSCVLDKIWGKPISLQDVKEIAVHWRKDYEKKVTDKINNLKYEKKQSSSEAKHEIMKLIMCMVSFDCLVYDWFEERMLPKEAQVYLLKNLIPTLVMGLEKLLIEAEKFEFNEVKEFNPINFLAQYLMRNNPCCKKNVKTSPYEKSIQKILNNFITPNVQNIKFEKEENLKDHTNALEEIFVKWTGQRNAVISLSLVQSLNCSFQEYFISKNEQRNDCSASMRENLCFKSADTTGELINIKEFVLYFNDHTWSEEAFEEFRRYALNHASTYTVSITVKELRKSLKDLFAYCDRGQINSLNRIKILNLVICFYDQAEESLKQSLRNPRMWPIVEFEEENNGDIDEIFFQEIKGKCTTDFLNTCLAVANKGGLNAGVHDGVHGGFNVGVHAAFFNKYTLNKIQFVNLFMLFLGDLPSRFILESLIKFVQVEYMNTKEDLEYKKEKNVQTEKDNKESEKRCMLINHLFNLWDDDSSGYLEVNEVESVLSNWCKDEMHNYLLSQTFGAFDRVYWKISRDSFKQIVDEICSLFPNEDIFDQLIKFLNKSVQRLKEEQKGNNFEARLLQTIVFSAQTSGGLIDLIYKQTFQAIQQFAQKHDKTTISAYVALLETSKIKTSNEVTFGVETNNPACSSINAIKDNKKILRYVATTVQDRDVLLNRVLHRGLKCVSFNVIDSGKPIYVQNVLKHGGVYLWNPLHKEIEGSFLCFPLIDEEQKTVGFLGIDTMGDPNETLFLSQEISFYQVVAKVLSQAMQRLRMLQKTIKISEDAVSWILKTCPHVKEVVIYLVEPDVEPNSEWSVLRKIVTLGQNHCFKTDNSPRLRRKYNIFRDYLFVCVDTSMAIIANELQEQHYAVPLRDVYGAVILILDISIYNVEKLEVHEMTEIHRVMKLLNTAQKEMVEVGENLTLEVERTHELQKLEFFFDRIILNDARKNVIKFGDRMLEELISYQEPPKIFHNILKAVLSVYLEESKDAVDMQKLEEWIYCKNLLNTDLVVWMTSFDPTALVTKKAENKFAVHLEDLRAEKILMIPKIYSSSTQYLLNWTLVCLSLMEKTKKITAAEC